MNPKTLKILNLVLEVAEFAATKTATPIDNTIVQALRTLLTLLQPATVGGVEQTLDQAIESLPEDLQAKVEAAAAAITKCDCDDGDCCDKK